MRINEIRAGRALKFAIEQPSRPRHQQLVRAFYGSQRRHGFKEPVPGLCTRTGDHADITVCTYRVPVAIAFLFVYLPLLDAIELEFVARGNSANGTCFRTDPAVFTKGLDADVNGFVMRQRHICGNDGQANSQSEFSGDQVTGEREFA